MDFLYYKAQRTHACTGTDSEPEGWGCAVNSEMTWEWKVLQSQASHFHASKKSLTLWAEFDTGCLVWVTRSFVCVRQVFVYLGFKVSRQWATFHFDSLQFNVSYFRKSKQVQVLAAHQTRTQARMLDCFSKIRPLNCHINKTTIQGWRFCESKAGLHMNIRRCPQCDRWMLGCWNWHWKAVSWWFCSAL